MYVLLEGWVSQSSKLTVVSLKSAQKWCMLHFSPKEGDINSSPLSLRSMHLKLHVL